MQSGAPRRWLLLALVLSMAGSPALADDVTFTLDSGWSFVIEDSAGSPVDLFRVEESTGNIYRKQSLFIHGSANSVFIGKWAGNLTASGSGNTAVGVGALSPLTSGSSNTAVGSNALANVAGMSTSVAVGSSALGGISPTSNTSADNVAVGFAALDVFDGSGNNNVAVGADSLGSLVAGTGNVALGQEAGIALASGSNNIYIGNGVVGAVSDSKKMILGKPDNIDITEIAGDTTVEGFVSASSVIIRAGSDIAEPFDVSSDFEIQPGMLVAIDPENPGALRLSDTEYDRTVAGVISGAGGVNSGLMLQQENSIADGSHPVALTGRVYAWVDADAGGAIRPGDLLTTSSTPGHAMKANDRDRAMGAVLGKAMTPLAEGRGLVLILVSLQ